MHSALYEHIAAYRSLALIGMCKNAGKTTVLGRILRDMGDTGRRLALTSIGRDGESTDLVTGTHKPGIYVREGTLLATAERLLPLCDITREILDATGVSTPMGEVILLRARSDGNVQLAGPSTVEQLVALSDRFRLHGADTVLIDGAISRKTLCSPALAEAAVLCAGASCGPGVEAVVEETRHSVEMLTLPRWEGEANSLPPGVSLTDAVSKGAKAVLVPGALTDSLVRSLLQTGRSAGGLTLVAADGSKVLLSADTVRKLRTKGIGLGVLAPVRVAAVTVNPFSAYGAPFNRAAFREAMSRAVDVPVLDVMADPI